MFLSKREIQDSIAQGRIIIEGYEPNCLKTASYVLRMSKTVNRIIALQDTGPVDIHDLTQVRKQVRQETCDSVTLRPGEFILASSMERLSLAESVGAFVSPLSHISRLGIGFLGSFYIRPGFAAEEPTPIVFEISNHGCLDLKLHAGMPFCHILFFEVKSADLDPGDVGGRRAVRSGVLFSRYDLNALYREIIRKGGSDQ